MKWFWPLWIFNAVMALVPVIFFFIGIGDGTVSQDNILLWILILGVIFLLLWGTYQLKKKNMLNVAIIFLAIASIPSILYVLFILMILIAQPRWN